MAPYWKTYYKRRYPRRRRWRIYRRRARKTFSRTKWRRRRQRFWNKVKRRRFFSKKKKKNLKIKVFQPRTINRCTIKGYKCLYQGSTKRLSHNYIQSIYATNPETYPTGGGWSLLVYSLDSFYEDYLHLENLWTKGNAGLPLCRFLGCKFKLYQAENSDYVFYYDNCWPLVDTPHTHANSSPSRMLQRQHKIVVPSRQNQKRKKPYKTVRIKPPPQMTNNWYFTHDIHKLPLVMTTTTSVSLTKPFANTNKESNNITLYCLNPYQFQNPNFQHFPELQGYSPKWLPLNNINTPIYWYATTMNHPTTITKDFVGSLEFLGNTKQNQAGKPIKLLNGNPYRNTKENWGNPFHHRYFEHTPETSYTIYFSTSTITELVNNYHGTYSTWDKLNFTQVTGPLVYTLTYNPAKDTGAKNQAYIVPTIDQNNMNPPENEDLKFHGFPLPILLWGWTDWLKKLKLASNFENDHLLVLETDMFDEKLPKYILIDEDFKDGFDPYQTHNDVMQQNYYNSQNWFPNLRYQNQSIEKICQTDVGTYKPTTNTYIQAYCKYYFYFKWGGCPKTLEKAYDPSLQPTWTTADSICRRPEIENPSIRAETQLFNWDWEEDFITENAIKRIKEYTTTKFLSHSTDSKSNPKATKAQKKTTEKEEKEEILQLIQLLRKQRMLNQLISKLQLKK
nr:MAG: ORF1 [TTV-like mini virus]